MGRNGNETPKGTPKGTPKKAPKRTPERLSRAKSLILDLDDDINIAETKEHKYLVSINTDIQTKKTTAKLSYDYFMSKLDELKSNLNINDIQGYISSVDIINSKIAQYYIIDSHLARKLTIKQGIEIWLSQIENPLARIFSLRRSKFKTKHEQAIFFATHCLYYLITGEYTTKNPASSSGTVIDSVLEDRPCPYTNNAWNFIFTLFRSNMCLCLCYATYIRAAAEEFNFSNYIYLCGGVNSSSVIIVDGMKQNRYKITKTDIKNFYVASFPTYLADKHLISESDIIHIPKSVVFLDVNYKDKFFIGVETVLPEKEFNTKYLSDIAPLQSKVESVEEISPICDRNFLWNDVVTLMERITSRRRSSHEMIPQLYVVGYVYDIVEIINGIISIYLILVERETQYNRWKIGGLKWNNYLSIQNHLDTLAHNIMDEMIDYIMSKNMGIFAIRNILMTSSLLLAKHKWE
jgi:hypothetical protein